MALPRTAAAVAASAYGLLFFLDRVVESRVERHPQFPHPSAAKELPNSPQEVLRAPCVTIPAYDVVVTESAYEVDAARSSTALRQLELDLKNRGAVARAYDALSLATLRRQYFARSDSGVRSVERFRSLALEPRSAAVIATSDGMSMPSMDEAAVASAFLHKLMSSATDQSVVKCRGAPAEDGALLLDKLGRPSSWSPSSPCILDADIICTDYVKALWDAVEPRFTTSPAEQRQQPDRVLVLGSGACPLVAHAQKHWPAASIVGVDVEEAINEVVKPQFGFEPSERTTLVTADAGAFTKQQIANGTRYDVVFVDIFVGDSVPEQFKRLEFLRELRSLMTSKGVMAANLPDSDADFTQHCQQAFRSVENRRCLHGASNVIYVCSNSD